MSDQEKKIREMTFKQKYCANAKASNSQRKSFSTLFKPARPVVAVDGK